MNPDRHRRLVALVLMCLLLLLTSWIEVYLDSIIDEQEPQLHSPPTQNVGKRKGKTSKEGGGGGGGGGVKGRKADYGGREEEEVDEEDYITALREKTRVLERSLSFNLNIHACLPRFICELHAQAPGATLTDFEKDVIDLFRNHVVLEGPGSPVYPYQVAAHMGQLCTGLEPSPCHSLYPACPLSRSLLIDVLRSVKTSRRMFY